MPFLRSPVAPDTLELNCLRSTVWSGRVGLGPLLACTQPRATFDHIA